MTDLLSSIKEKFFWILSQWNVLECPVNCNSCVIKNGETQCKATGGDQCYKLTLAQKPMAGIFADGPVAPITQIILHFVFDENTSVYHGSPQRNIRASRMTTARIARCRLMSVWREACDIWMRHSLSVQRCRSHMSHPFINNNRIKIYSSNSSASFIVCVCFINNRMHNYECMHVYMRMNYVE